MSYHNFYGSLPKKRMGSGALFFNSKSELLIVNPIYKPNWTIPGGIVDQDESPLKACKREVKEELGLDLEIKQMLCIDYIPKEDDKEESLQFIFYGGILNEEQISKIKLPEGELSEFKFVNLAKVGEYKKSLAKKLPICLRAIREKKTYYLEDGKEI